MDSNTTQQRTATTGNQERPANVTIGGATLTQPREGATKAQSEIGPITYGGPNGPVSHAAGDAETKSAYAAGHPAQGIEHQRAQASPQQQGQPQQGQPAAQAQTTSSGTAQSAGTLHVRMVRDEGAHTAGQEVDLPIDEAHRLIGAGAAQQV